jgi:hypothetical protein
MTKQKLVRKFSKYLSILEDAVDGTVNLDQDYPQLYKNIYEFYDTHGIQLFGDPDEDYELVLTQLERDLTS